LKLLKSVERPAIIRAIAEAREHGDLSENAEYHSAKEKQSFIEGRIKELEGTISLAQVIDPKTLSGPIKFGATVVLVDEDDVEKTYRSSARPRPTSKRAYSTSSRPWPAP
jgi:transcription elongation factor GreA